MHLHPAGPVQRSSRRCTVSKEVGKKELADSSWAVERSRSDHTRFLSGAFPAAVASVPSAMFGALALPQYLCSTVRIHTRMPKTVHAPRVGTLILKRPGPDSDPT
eukprot:4570364-Alexandrium_andersonii.AAC.1